MKMELSRTSRDLLERYAAVRGELVGADLPWLAKIRDAAADRFRVTGMPTTRMEEWKYTSLKALDGRALVAGTSAEPVEASDLPAKLGAGPRLVFVAGRLRPDLSDAPPDDKDFRLASLAEYFAIGPELVGPRLADFGDGQPMLALNAAFQEDGYVVKLASGADAGAPVEILFWDAGGGAAACQPRNLIVAAPGSRVEIIERHIGAAPSQQFFNGATMITVDEDASVRHLRLQGQGAGSVHVNTVRARIGGGGRYESFVLAEGAQVARDEVRVALTASGATCRLDGIYLGRGDQVVDNTTSVRMAAPGTECREIYRGALDGSARGVFQGHIRVERGADGADGRMANNTLLLSDRSEIDTKPQLEIFHDNVKCAHGATAGELDREALFYLRARGIPEDTARGILVEGFLDEVVGELSDDPAAAEMRAHIARWLGRTHDEALAA
jgi:Fe-S cluster assembly protein SufD